MAETRKGNDMNEGQDVYVKLLAKHTANTVATLYLGLFFGGLFGAAGTFICMQPR